ncbi:MFS transporter [Kineosporia sp. NBRC 101677]|uniref:MFS transporter n=1 Tax=Kineosporia sp. NBRC 101677 TaxID=3032197 RepID=UPI00255783F5|nr:MFS transporter [Kineosporia sp. NBRC 101677]
MGPGAGSGTGSGAAAGTGSEGELGSGPPASAWGNRSFRRVWAAGTASEAGTQIADLSLPVLAVVTLGASAFQLSLTRAAFVVPYLLLPLWVGVLVDRRARRPLMISADLARGLLLLAVAGLALAGWLSLPVLIGAALAVGSFGVLYVLAEFAFLPSVVTREQLADANARTAATRSALEVAGSGMGGAIVQVLTAPFAVLVNAFAYLGSALLLRRVVADEQAAPETQPSGTWRAAREGVSTLRRSRILRPLAAEAATWNLGNEILLLALTVHLVNGLELGALILGGLLMTVGVGAVLGSATSARLTARFGYGPALVAALVLGNSAPLVGLVAGAGLDRAALIGLGVAFFVSGVGIGVADSQAATVRQLSTPSHLQGRVNSAYRLFSWGALAIGALLAGGLVTQFGAYPAALIGASFMALATLPVALSPVRRMRTLTQEPASPH